ncbi:MAG TPA: M12 family metallo-peptidase [Thermoanaerobaculia bacterium]|nr:M12 family metallo-peptidase [Thermoanaerobaculia bacterium]
MALHFRCTARRVAARALALLTALVIGGPLAAARPDGPLSAGASGKIVDLSGGRGEGELLRFDAGLVPALLALAPEEGVAVLDWPFAPGVRRAVRVERHEVWADGAKVFRVDAGGRTEIPRSRLVFFWGSDTEGAGGRVLVAVDPSTGALTALAHGPEGVHEIARDPSDAAGRHLLAAPARPDFTGVRCGQEDFPDTASLPASVARHSAAGRSAAVLGSLYKGILAIDTDTEYLASFGNNTTTTTNYIATLVANINVMYERDLNLRLVVGTTFLRTGTDPWTVTGSGASGSQLNEFTSYWNTNYPKATYPRSFAVLFSGKSTSGLSGIAWVAGSVCGSGNDYSFNQISANGSWLWGDTLIVGHEVGHNMGSPHTHCYANPAPDRCYAGESCYSGATSCPAPQTINGVANVTGTIMSYCHLSGISGCGTSLVFHPLTVSRYVGPALDAGASSACISLVVPPPPPPPPVSAATGFNAVPPCRLLDTRNAAGPLGAPSLGALASRSFVATGNCGIPSGAVAISANVTVVSPTVAGDLVAYPNGLASPPGTSTISFRAGRTRANNALVYLAGDGSFLVTNRAAGSLDLVVDVNGYTK